MATVWVTGLAARDLHQPVQEIAAPWLNWLVEDAGDEPMAAEEPVAGDERTADGDAALPSSAEATPAVSCPVVSTDAGGGNCTATGRLERE
jgi:hypothetical protein